MIDKQIYTPEECADLFPFLDTLEIEYHKPYKRFNQIVKVPRGQASYTLDDTIHYDYKVSGGSPPNYIMCETLKQITARVNEVLGTNFNTILLRHCWTISTKSSCSCVSARSTRSRSSRSLATW